MGKRLFWSSRSRVRTLRRASSLVDRETRKDVDTPSQATETRCSSGNVEKVTAGKQGQHRRRCGQWNNEITCGAGGIVHSAQVTLTNTDKTETICHQKEVKWRLSASLHGAWLYLAYFLQSIRQESQDNRDHLQLKDMKSGILPPDHDYTQQFHFTQSDRKAAACLVFLEADVNFSAESWFPWRPWLRKVKMSQTTRKLHNCRTRMCSALTRYLDRGDPTRWAKAHLREVSLSAVCGTFLPQHSSGCKLGLGGDYERTCQHIDIDIFESVYYHVDQFLAYLHSIP